MRHLTLTLSGSSQPLSDALPNTDVEQSLTYLSLQPAGANANVIYVGGANATVSSSDHGVRLEAGDSGVPPAPFIVSDQFSPPIKLSGLRVLGTASQLLHIFCNP